MHELPVMQSILSIVLRHASMHRVTRVHAISLTVGELSDLEQEWMQKYFDHLSKGTPAEGARLKITWVKAVLSCDSCGCRFDMDRSRQGELVCPACGRERFSLVSGREYRISEMEAE
jgi:hydrogenase nickel incorporation protein HypA/HybF